MEEEKIDRLVEAARRDYERSQQQRRCPSTTRRKRSKSTAVKQIKSGKQRINEHEMAPIGRIVRSRGTPRSQPARTPL